MSTSRKGGKKSNPQNLHNKTSSAPPTPAANPSNPDSENARLDASRAKCLQVVELMHYLGLNLDTFLHDVIYGNPRARDVPAFKKARGDLRTSPLLLDILDTLHTVPRTKSKGKQAEGAIVPLEAWAKATMDDIYRKELLQFSESMRCDIDELVDDDIPKQWAQLVRCHHRLN